MAYMTQVVIVGGGPGGYEAASVAAQLGADVTLIERDGIGGAFVLTDSVPSKAIIAASETLTMVERSRSLGIDSGDSEAGADLRTANARAKRLVSAQSQDILDGLQAEGVRVIRGNARLVDPRVVAVGDERLCADVVLVATGATPRVLRGCEPDGERILTWRQPYDLDVLPEKLIVVGSGMTGVEFAHAYQNLGSFVTLICSRDHVLPTVDPDAGIVLQDVFMRRGMTIITRSRAAKVDRTSDGVIVTLTDGRIVAGTHCLMAVGIVPNTQDIGLEESGVKIDERGFVRVDRVSRTTAQGIYAAGDCTGIMMFASVAAMQGQIAIRHALGESVSALRGGLREVASAVFTAPEIASVGVTQLEVNAGEVVARTIKLPLRANARAKMEGSRDGFIKLFCRPGTGIVIGGVIVAPRASELILALSVAVQASLTVDDLARSFAVYPSIASSVTEAARRLSDPREL
jgi:pyruvate/2-oxoglutarate dehydrogenase complex dihydrolipoamide dehydrogenase (E3) component